MIFLSVATPTLFWLWYFYKKDKLKPEPKKVIVKMFFWWVVSVVPALIVEIFLGWVVPVEVFGLVIVAPIIEELCKFWIVKKKSLTNRHFDDLMDGVLYACVVALGFATFENIFYLVDANSQWMLWEVALIRAFVSVPWHALFGAIWWYALGLRKFFPEKYSSMFVVKALWLGIFFHATLNFLTLYSVAGAIGMICLMVVMWVVFHKRIGKLKKIEK